MTDTPSAAPVIPPRLRDLIIERLSHVLVGAALVFAVHHGLLAKSAATQLSDWLDAGLVALIGAAWTVLCASHALASWVAALNAPAPAAGVPAARSFLSLPITLLFRASAARETGEAAVASPAAAPPDPPLTLELSAAAQEMNTMAIITDALKGKITWPQAAQEIGAWFSQVGKRVLSDPVASQAANDLQNVVKQGASNALALADTELGQHLGEATSVVEGAADTLLLKATGGVAAPAVPFMNAGIEQAIGILKSALDAKELEWKAKLQTPAAPAPAPAPAPQPEAA